MLTFKYDKSLVLAPLRWNPSALKLKGIVLNAGKSPLRAKLSYERYRTFSGIVGFFPSGAQLLTPDTASSQACFLLYRLLVSVKFMTIGLYSQIVERTWLGLHLPSLPTLNTSLLLNPHVAVCTT